jgi:hypothetical protein
MGKGKLRQKPGIRLFDRMLAKAETGAMIVGDLLDDVSGEDSEIETAINATMDQLEALIIVISKKADEENGE